MIPPESPLYIYEVPGDSQGEVPSPPASFVGLWNEEGFSYLFFTDIEDDYVRTKICSESPNWRSRHEMTYHDWQTGIPTQGLNIAGLFFVPTDYPAPPEGAILLDPSVVFGDGNHPTTISCLRMLVGIVSAQSIQSVMDLGTGTGILGLAAAAMGIRRVVAVDRNLLAVRTARENVRSNSLGPIITVHEGEARFFMDSPFDLVAANLPFGVLRDLLTMRDIALHRFWIISGIDQPQARVLRDILEEQGYALGEMALDHPWVTFTMFKR